MHKLAEVKEIYPGSKLTHFRRIHNQTGIEYEDMLFFDNESWNIKVCSDAIRDAGAPLDFRVPSRISKCRIAPPTLTGGLPSRCCLRVHPRRHDRPRVAAGPGRVCQSRQISCGLGRGPQWSQGRQPLAIQRTSITKLVADSPIYSLQYQPLSTYIPSNSVLLNRFHNRDYPVVRRVSGWRLVQKIPRPAARGLAPGLVPATTVQGTP